MKRLDVLCIGELNVDIFCSSLEELPDPGSFVLMDRICMFPGGCPVNTAIVTSMYGLKTGLNTLVGGDNTGDFVLKELQSQGVVTSYITRIEYGETGKTIILISKVKDRVLLHFTGINNRFGMEHVDLSLVRDTRAVLISSYISGLPNLGPVDASLIFKTARENGSITFLDMLVDPNEIKPMKKLKEVLPFTDYIILNNIEGRLVTGHDDYHDQADTLLCAGASNVIIKLGKDGSYIKNVEGDYFAPPYHVETADPTGSGDSFNGGFIYGRLQGWDTRKTMRFANIVGASAVTEIGCTCGVYSLDEVNAIMREGGEE